MVNSFYADPAVGGDGTTTDDSTSATTGLDNGGHRTRLIPMLSQVVAICTFVKNACTTAASAAAASAATAINAPGTSATSTTSDTIAVGSTTFTLVQTGKAFGLGQWIIMASTASLSNYMVGQITAFNSATGVMTINVPTGAISGSGTFTAWSIALTAPFDATLSGRVTALENENIRLKGRRRLLYKEIN